MNSLWCISDEELEKELKQVVDRLAEIKEEKRNRDLWSPAIRLARQLHTALCHARDCDYYYQNWSEAIMTNLFEPGHYLNMAKGLQSQFSDEQIAVLIPIIGRR